MLQLAVSKSLRERVRQDDGGFTLVELLVGISIGMFLTFAGYTALDAANRSQLSTINRVESINRARNAMETVTRAVRSQQCYNGLRPMRWASATGMQFYSSVAPTPANAGQKQPVEEHRIEWVPTTTDVADIGRGNPVYGTVGDIKHTVYRATINPVTGVQTIPTTPTTSHVIARGVQPTEDRRDPTKMAPIFRYFEYASTTGSGRVNLSSPVPMVDVAPDAKLNPTGLDSALPADLAGIVLVEVSFQAVPRKLRSAATKAPKFHNTISVRIADPTNPAGSPQCL